MSQKGKQTEVKKNFIINTDGAARGNPGPAAASYVISSPEGVIWTQGGAFLGVATNNQAEYSAVKHALEKLLSEFKEDLPARVEIRSDSTLIVNQLAGKFKIKNAQLYSVAAVIKEMEKNIGTVTYTYIPREKNTLADRIANLILDQQNG